MKEAGRIDDEGRDDGLDSGGGGRQEVHHSSRVGFIIPKDGCSVKREEDGGKL